MHDSFSAIKGYLQVAVMKLMDYYQGNKEVVGCEYKSKRGIIQKKSWK